MTPQARMRRIGWFATLVICAGLYLVLHFNVHSLSSEVIKAERQIVQLEEQNMLLETEFLTRSSQVQLAAWNRMDFGYSAPEAAQFVDNERQLAQFGTPRGENAPAPILLARHVEGEEAPPFRQLVSPITGEQLDVALINTGNVRRSPSGFTGNGARAGAVDMVANIAQSAASGSTVRIPLNATASVAGVSLANAGGAGQ